MKTEFTIKVITKDMEPIYATEKPSEHTEENNLMVGIEKELHKAIEMIVRQYLTIENLNESILNNYIVDFDVTEMKGVEDLGELGNIKIFFKNDKTKKKIVDIKKIGMMLQEKIPEEER